MGETVTWTTATQLVGTRYNELETVTQETEVVSNGHDWSVREWGIPSYGKGTEHCEVMAREEVNVVEGGKNRY